jgi:hypothetical protein
MHSVDYGREGNLCLRFDGTILAKPEGTRWELAGAVLSMHWPRDDAPEGTWIDRCLVSADARWYVGRNRQGMVIRGRSLSQTATPGECAHGAPIREMPAGVPAPPGELSLYADYASVRDGEIDLYLVNRGKEWVLVSCAAGRPMLTIETKIEDGTWAAEGPLPTREDGVVRLPPVLRPGAYFRFPARLPDDTGSAPIRYRFPGHPDVVSNEGGR